MKNTNTRAYIYTVCTLLLIACTAVFVLGADRQYKVKNTPVTAAEIEITADASMITDEFIKTTADYFRQNSINTAILKVNNGTESIVNLSGFGNILSSNENFEKKDIVTQIKRKLNSKKIQLYLSVDCTGLDGTAILSAVQQLCDNYKIAGIVLDNFTESERLISDVSSICDKTGTDFIIQADAVSLHSFSNCPADRFICENLGYDQHVALKTKGDIKQDILLHYSSPSMMSDMYLLTNFSQLDGAVVCNYTGGQADNLLLSTTLAKNSTIPLFNMGINNRFTVTYPAKDVSTYYSGIFITGTAQPGTVNINDAEYATAKDGSFGVYFELEEGDTPFTVSQNGNSKEFTVTRKVYKSTGVKYETPWDETEYLEKGRIIQTVSRLTSLLSDPDDDSAIIAGLEPGTKMVVTESVETTRSGYKTYAYKLSNGGFVLASKVEILPEITADFTPAEESETDFSQHTVYENPVISSVSREKFKNSDEQLYIAVNNTPAVTSSYTNEKLTLFFLDAVAEDIALPQSDFYKSYSVNTYDGGTEISLFFDETAPLWGYDVKAEQGQFIVYLKQTPHLSKTDKPLQGITIMLDAGHGGKDSGALGVASTNGPLEKDLNLAVSQATKAILQQYGATVIMTRDDDAFPSLEDRRALVRDHKPDLFIAQHHNSMDYSYNSSNTMGSECYYFTHQSENLAQLMCSHISTAAGRNNRGAYPAYFYVTRTDICPAVLMEYGYVINPYEFSNLYNDTDIYKAAFGTVQAVLKAIPQ